MLVSALHIFYAVVSMTLLTVEALNSFAISSSPPLIFFQVKINKNEIQFSISRQNKTFAESSPAYGRLSMYV